MFLFLGQTKPSVSFNLFDIETTLSNTWQSLILFHPIIMYFLITLDLCFLVQKQVIYNTI